MNKSDPFTLHIFVVDGDPDGLRIIERTNWSGKALMFPRALYPQVRGRSELKQPGVYLLLGPRTDGPGERLYIGEGDPILDRLDSHLANKEFWQRAVFFVAGQGQLNKAHVQYLESQLVARAKAAKQMQLENGNAPTEPTLSESERACMEVFLQILLRIVPVLGVPAFEHSTSGNGNGQFPSLFCKGRGASANGHDTPQGFVVRAGSTAAVDEVPSVKQHFPNVCQLRADLLQNGVLVQEGKTYKFTQDYTFSSPSFAGAVVMARSCNGRTDWKDSSGKTLKELQEAQSAK
jgi:hypothetical protein